MSCFCRASVARLASVLPALDVPPEQAAATGAVHDDPQSRHGTEVAHAVSSWLASRGLPAAPWHPDPAWHQLQLPMPKLPVSAITTISGLAQLRAQVLAQYGHDLLIPAHANSVARIVATMNVRLTTELPRHLGGPTAINPSGWVKLATLNNAVDQIHEAMKQGLLTPQESQVQAMTTPGGIPISQWGNLLRPLRMLAPLIAACMQLDASVTDTVQLAAAVKVLARITLPPLAAPELMASLTAALAATASLQTSLGVAPLKVGLAEVKALVHAKQKALLHAMSNRMRTDLTHPGTTQAAEKSGGHHAPENATVKKLLAALPKLPVVPSSLATPDVVRIAAQAHALASLTWQVPERLPVIATGLSTCTLTAQMHAALGVQAVLPAPCRSGCDAAALLRAASAA